MDNNQRPVGRPPRGYEVRIVSVQLEIHEADWLKAKGNGNTSHALKEMIHAAMASEEHYKSLLASSI